MIRALLGAALWRYILAGCCVERIHSPKITGRIHYPVDHQRRRLLAAIRAEATVLELFDFLLERIGCIEHEDFSMVFEIQLIEEGRKMRDGISWCACYEPRIGSPAAVPQAAARPSSSALSRVLRASAAARENSVRASSNLLSFSNKSPRTLGSQ